MPFFSIILPTYNRAHFLPTAIESVLNQTFGDWELIIVDDGSIDNTKEVVCNYVDNRIHNIYQENAERSVARNNGVEYAKGEWICFLDSDDEYLENHLSTLKTEIENRSNQLGLYVTGHLIESNGFIKKHPLLNTTMNTVKEIWSKFILINSVCVHYSILEKNKFNTNYRIWEDTHLWLRIAVQYPTTQIPTYTCKQNITSESSVQQGYSQVKIKEVIQYITAINDLKINYCDLFLEKISTKDFNTYITSKYQMYLYQARQNKQLGVALRIWLKAFVHQPSVYLIKEFPKIFINQFNIGIHEK